jgi:hypothetical protein
VSDDDADPAEAPGDADKAFAERQRDAKFTVDGTAPAWAMAMKWPDEAANPA